MNLRFCFTFFVALIATGSTLCCGQLAAPDKPASTGIVRGHIADPSGALIPGAQVTLAKATGTTIAHLVTDASGNYTATGVIAGSYVVTATAAGFAPSTSAVFSLAPGQVQRIDLAISVLAEAQSVTVSGDDAPTVSLDADSNTDAVVMKDNDLDALSDDPDELSNELTALAGPAAGPNGGSIYIAGFSGGQLPPKSAIREIRVNQNPYSSEYDTLGYGRVEVLTKPGTDQLHGRFFMQGNDDVFNTGNPFTTTIPAYHSLQYNGSISGTINKKASFFFNAEQRNNQNASIYSVTNAVLNTTKNLYESGATSGSVFTPSGHTAISPRIDVQLGEKNTLSVRYQFERYHLQNSLGSSELPTQAVSSHWHEHALQSSDSIVINSHIAHEIRFQYLHDESGSTPASTTPTISVPGSFYSGGESSQHNRETTDEFELQDLTTMSAGTHAIKFGTRLRYNREESFSDTNFNGRFTFSSLDSYITLLNDLASNATWAQIKTDGGLPNKLAYTTGPETTYARLFDGALFVQDDWKANQFLTLSGGLRWETQNQIDDHNDWGPRVAFAYALDGHKDQKQARTVLRGGYGFFYNRFGLSNVLNLRRYNGSANSQAQTTINSPQCFSATSLASVLASCGTGSSADKTIVQVMPGYHSPYVSQLGFTLERQLAHNSSLSITGLRSYGVHQMVTRDSNAYVQGSYVYGDATKTGTRPDASLGIVKQYYPEGIFKQNQFIVNFTANMTQRFSFSGYYDLSSVRSNTGTASNSYDIKQDYQRPTWNSRHMLFLRGSYTAPLRLVFDPFMMAQSGKRYNYVSPYDLTGDNFYNNRPALTNSADCTTGSETQFAQTSVGCFDMTPSTGTTVVPNNMGRGPAAVAFNMRLSRAFGFGPKTDSTQSASSNPSSGFRSFNGMNTGHKYTLAFSLQALNLFNNISYGQPTGTVNSSLFGKSTSLVGGIFSSGSAARRVYMQTVFSF
jgi:hypothetical protein